MAWKSVQPMLGIFLVSTALRLYEHVHGMSCDLKSQGEPRAGPGPAQGCHSVSQTELPFGAWLTSAMKAS